MPGEGFSCWYIYLFCIYVMQLQKPFQNALSVIFFSSLEIIQLVKSADVIISLKITLPKVVLPGFCKINKSNILYCPEAVFCPIIQMDIKKIAITRKHLNTCSSSYSIAKWDISSRIGTALFWPKLVKFHLEIKEITMINIWIILFQEWE